VYGTVEVVVDYIGGVVVEASQHGGLRRGFHQYIECTYRADILGIAYVAMHKLDTPPLEISQV
jgi:hypothetical protein